MVYFLTHARKHTEIKSTNKNGYAKSLNTVVALVDNKQL